LSQKSKLSSDKDPSNW